jgi:hypothetical protein
LILSSAIYSPRSSVGPLTPHQGLILDEQKSNEADLPIKNSKHSDKSNRSSLVWIHHDLRLAIDRQGCPIRSRSGESVAHANVLSSIYLVK